MILAGDIGGTKTRLAFFASEGECLQPLEEETFPSREYGGLTEIVDMFVSMHPGAVASAGFGIAGPVKHGRCEATNLPWVVDARQLASQLGLPSVVVPTIMPSSTLYVALPPLTCQPSIDLPSKSAVQPSAAVAAVEAPADAESVAPSSEGASP